MGVTADSWTRRKGCRKHHEERVALGLSKEADDYVPKNEHIIADPINLSPIIPLHIRKQLSEEVRALGLGQLPPVKSDSVSIQFTSKLVRTLSQLDSTEECKDQ